MYLPDGVKDYLSEELDFKHMIENKLRMLFTSWGYDEVLPPSFEYNDTFKNTLRSIDERDIYRFFDKEGEILALRPDTTTQIARIAATRYRDVGIKKFCYITNVFRYDEPQAGRMREFTQGGIEFIGTDSQESDAEVIALAIKALNKIGLKDFKIDIGHIKFLDSFLEDFQLDDLQKDQIKAFVSAKNISALENYLSDLNICGEERHLILELPGLFGGYNILSKAKTMTSNKKAIKALDILKSIYSIFQDINLSEYIIFDLGITQKLPYYTGVVFEGFVRDIGYSILTGGRYDNLISKFGVEKPAIGFALGIERAMLALLKQRVDVVREKRRALVICTRNNIKDAYKKAEDLRRDFTSVEIVTSDDIGKYDTKAFNDVVDMGG